MSLRSKKVEEYVRVSRLTMERNPLKRENMKVCGLYHQTLKQIRIFRVISFTLSCVKQKLIKSERISSESSRFIPERNE